MQKNINKQEENQNKNCEIIHLLKKQPKYWDTSKMDSYNCFFNGVQGGRGKGKTTSLCRNKIKRYSKTGEQFIYLRRWKSETKKCKDLLSKYIANKYNVEGIGDGAYKWSVNKNIIGYCIPLSTSQQFKSVDFEKVTSIIYDEAIIKKSSTNRYLEDEIQILLEFISTVFRTRKNCKVYIIGNNNDVFNPYFEYFKIPPFKDFYLDKNRGLYWEFVKTEEELAREEKETGLYKLTLNTAYGEYHYNNELLIKDNTMIIEKPKNLSFCYSLLVNNYTLHIYNSKEYYLYCEFIPEIKRSEKIFKIMENNNINYALCKELKYTQLMKRLVWEYYNNNIYYNSPQAICILEDLIKYFK